MSGKQLGIIGLGLLGSAITERLLAAGYALSGYDLDADRRQAFAQAGGEVAASAAAVAAANRVILLSLPDSEIVRQVIGELSPQLSPGCLLIDTTTGDPADSVALASELAERDVAYVDATVVGSSFQVRERDCIVLTGGNESAVQFAKKVCATFARECFHVGPSGSGARMKLVVNLVLGLNRAVLAEGLSLAGSLELDPQLALAVLKASAAYSRVMDAKGQKMISQDFTPQARLAQHAKDVGLIISAAEQAGARVPLSTVHAQLLSTLISMGLGDKDNSAIIAAFQPDPKHLN